VLALKYLAEKTPFGSDEAWDGQVSSLESALGVSRTEAMLKLQEVTGLDAVAATQLLWETYRSGPDALRACWLVAGMRHKAVKKYWARRG
jgi:hypothetical protein